jgi:hypothetical protein
MAARTQSGSLEWLLLILLVGLIGLIVYSSG